MWTGQAQFVVNVLRGLGRRFLSWQLPLQVLYLGDIMFCALVGSQIHMLIHMLMVTEHMVIVTRNARSQHGRFAAAAQHRLDLKRLQ